jgi:hypothetical protein
LLRRRLPDRLGNVPGFPYLLAGNGIPASGENCDALVVTNVSSAIEPAPSSQFGSRSGLKFPEDSPIHWLESSGGPSQDEQELHVVCSGSLEHEVGPVSGVYVENEGRRISLSNVAM